MKNKKFTKDDLRVLRSTERVLRQCEQHLVSMRQSALLAELKFEEFCEVHGLIYSPRKIL